MRALFGPEREVRFRTHYFPFTEPSMEPDVSCCELRRRRLPDVQALRLDRDGRLGDGRPARVRERRLRPGGVTAGFAFGCGLERIAQLRYDIPTIRAVLGERPPLPEAVPMRVPLSWLREYVDVDA